MAKILVALSGGVDSAVAAFRLKAEGHDISGAYMKNWINEDDILGDCPWEEDIEHARAVAQHLGIDFEVANFIQEYKDRVVQYLVDGYRRGITPNPDVMCNREMKFGVLLDWAKREGFEAVATGHYCRKLEDSEGEPELWEGVDKNKDQSYFLAMISPGQLRAARFPIGDISKPEVREIAERESFPNARRKDSQGICFIGQVRINDFLEHYIEEKAGEIVNLAGEAVGEHKGLHRYTLGQRRGIGVPSNTDNEHYVVVGKDLDTNRLIVGFDRPESEGLYQGRMRLHGLSWLTEPIMEKRRLLAKPRYRDPSEPITFTPTADGCADIHFDSPQRALASGQVCALYDGERLLGGGVYM